MLNKSEFDDIRPYDDEEVSPVIEGLMKDSEFRSIIRLAFPEKEEEMIERMRSFRSVNDFQFFLKDLLSEAMDGKMDSIRCGGWEWIQKDRAYTYISNHRDIVLDASLLCSLLVNKGYKTAEVAIGDNLLLHSWIKNVVRLNKSFIVRRGVPIRQMLEVSTHLSRYIHYAVCEKHESVWIAQREGRAKDSNDRTQESLLKMLGIGGTTDFGDNIKELNIVPVSLSYEYDPCDYLKAAELQQKRDDPDFKKSQDDDWLNMTTGLLGYKGNIHFQFGRPVNSLLENQKPAQSRNEWVQTLASLIDKEIFLNYKFYPCNYVAYDCLWGKNYFADKYTKEDIETFNNYLYNQLEKVDLANKDNDFLKRKIMEMYANPVKNQLEVK
ncbi:MAG: acyltransferase [Candidatus Azobacteroides sp.]|nr:acyltransferase [Candidatus Azobacteroides sp.]